jgi:LysR family transcriptional activator of nhaA
MYNYNHLFYFYICAHFKSISKAATHLKTSQPSLSIQIKTLEENLEMVLFSRTGRSIELTNNGKILFSFCEKMFSETQNISDFIKTKSLYKRENISIGVQSHII